MHSVKSFSFTNATFDNKLGILSKKQQDMQFIAAMSTREVAEDCVRLMRNSFDESVLARISECLSVSNKYIYIAQHWDINLLTVANAERFADYEYFLKEYTRRCHFGSGIFSGQCAYAGAMLSGASGEQLEALKSFGEAYGTALHMINDLGDLVPCAGGEGRIRDYQDFFSDLRNGRLTLPLYLLRRATDDSGSALTWLTKVDSASDQRFRELPALLVQTGTSNVIKALVSTKMQDAIDVLDVFRGSASYGVIRAMSSVVRTNKYFARLRLL